MTPENTTRLERAELQLNMARHIMTNPHGVNAYDCERIYDCLITAVKITGKETGFKASALILAIEKLGYTAGNAALAILDVDTHLATWKNSLN